MTWPSTGGFVSFSNVSNSGGVASMAANENHGENKQKRWHGGAGGASAGNLA